MIFLLIVSLLIYAAYSNQTTYINYLLAFCIVLSIISIICSLIAYFTTHIDVEIDKDICLINGDKNLFFYSSSFLHPSIIVKARLYNKQLKKKQGVYYINVKTDGCVYNLPTDVYGDIDVMINSYTLKGFLGLIRIKKRFKKHLSYKVYPRAGKYEKSDVKELIITGEGEPINKKGGDYQELFEVRPIQPGDDLRHIHSSLSAKYGEYMIKVGSESQRNLILYDLEKKEAFEDMIFELKKISAIFDDTCKDNKYYFYVKYKYNWYIVINERSLYGLFDLVYEDYIE